VESAVSSREAVLGRVRSALAGAPSVPSAPRLYRRQGTLDREGRVALFCERAGDYRAEVRRVPSSTLAGAVGQALASRGAQRVGVPPGLPSVCRPPEIEVVEDHGLSAQELDALDGVVTGCTLAIAETGTIVLSGGPVDGRRALTLVPDLHVCVVVEAQVVELVTEAMGLLSELVRTERRPLTFVSGPSATSDIELSRVEGVHGPRNLVVLVAGS
jgi:L-lactate dehydrogenase complex protein LldG